MGRYNADGTLNWSHPVNMSIQWTLGQRWKEQDCGCWESDVNPTSEGLVWHTQRNAYDVKYVYCWDGTRTICCVNPDHIDVGGICVNGPNSAC